MDKDSEDEGTPEVGIGVVLPLLLRIVEPVLLDMLAAAVVLLLEEAEGRAVVLQLLDDVGAGVVLLEVLAAAVVLLLENDVGGDTVVIDEVGGKHIDKPHSVGTHEYPASTVQLELHPSSSPEFPSSHTSSWARIPSPHVDVHSLGSASSQ